MDNLDAIERGWPVIKKAPGHFAGAVAALGVLIWFGLGFYYSGQIASLEREVAAAKQSAEAAATWRAACEWKLSIERAEPGRAVISFAPEKGGSIDGIRAMLREAGVNFNDAGGAVSFETLADK